METAMCIVGRYQTATATSKDVFKMTVLFIERG